MADKKALRLSAVGISSRAKLSVSKNERPRHARYSASEKDERKFKSYQRLLTLGLKVLCWDFRVPLSAL
jgi:hypothetical protein